MVKNVIFLLKRILKDREKESNFKKKKKMKRSYVCCWPEYPIESWVSISPLDWWTRDRIFL